MTLRRALPLLWLLDRERGRAAIRWAGPAALVLLPTIGVAGWLAGNWPDWVRQFRRMAAIHEQWIVELFSAWSDPDKQRVHGLLATLKTHLATREVPTTIRRKQKEKIA